MIPPTSSFPAEPSFSSSTTIHSTTLHTSFFRSGFVSPFSLLLDLLPVFLSKVAPHLVVCQVVVFVWLGCPDVLYCVQNTYIFEEDRLSLLLLGLLGHAGVHGIKGFSEVGVPSLLNAVEGVEGHFLLLQL